MFWGLGPSEYHSRYPSSTRFPFFVGGVSLLQPNSRKKGTLTILGLLGNLVFYWGVG